MLAYYSSSSDLFLSLFSGGTGIVVLVLSIILLVGYFKLFQKAGQSGILAFIPFVNLLVMAKIAKVPLIALVLMLIPFVNGIFALYFGYKFVNAYGFGFLGYLAYLFLNPIFIVYAGFSENVRYQY